MNAPISPTPPLFTPEQPPKTPPAGGSKGGPLVQIWKILTSLRTTVVILGLSALLVFFGTLAQVKDGLYLAQERWFQSWIVWWQKGGVGLKIPIFPGGYLLGTLFLTNLLCSHFRRFKFPPGGLPVLFAHYAVVAALLFAGTYFLLWQPLWYSLVMVAILALDMVLVRTAGGPRLQASGRKIGIDLAHAGLVVMLVGQLVTDMTAEETHLSFREGETKRYSESHMACELAVTTEAEGDASKNQVVAIPQNLVESAAKPLRHEQLPFSIRIKEWMPNADMVERQEAIEAQASLAQAFATLEAKYSSKENLLEEAGNADAERTALWRNIIDGIGASKPGAAESLPQTVERISLDPDKFPRLQEGLKQEFRRRMLAGFKQRGGVMGFVAERHEKGDPVTETSPPPQADSPVARRYFLIPLPERRDMNSRNLPAAIVELSDAATGSLGTWILTPHLKPQTVRAAGREWRLSLRFARTYHPFAMTLLKTTHKVYPGTDTPRDFRSRVHLVRDRGGENREIDIYMNNPLRLKDLKLTFFQHQMGRDEAQMNVGTSTLQVVHNPGWFSPYFACALVGYGLLRHFLVHLLRFISKRRTA